MENSKINIELDRNTNSAIVSYLVGPKKIVKNVSVQDLIDTFKVTDEKNKNNEKIYGDIYLEYEDMSLIQTLTVGKNVKYYILRKKKSKQPFSIYNKFYGFCGIPELLFAIKSVNNNYSNMKVVCTSGLDSNITEDTKIYCYPFSNVSNANSNVCTGANNLTFKFDDKKNIFKIPSCFFSMPNTMESFHNQNNSKGYNFDDLMLDLQEKDFPTNYLVENPQIKTYKQWISILS